MVDDRFPFDAIFRIVIDAELMGWVRAAYDAAG
jgi:hypothetical protein